MKGKIMKKTVLVLAVLMLAVPAMAGIRIDANQVGSTGVKVSYVMTGGDVNIPRAFALDVNMSPANGVALVPTGFDPNFYVAPGTFTYNDVNGATYWGTRYVGADVNGFIAEMGSLYVGGPNQPKSTGTLFSFTVTKSCTITLAQNAQRGGVVMEDVNKTFPPGYVELYGCVVTVVLDPPAQILYPTSDPDCNIPVSWSAVAGATKYELDRSANSGSTWTQRIYDGNQLSKVDSVGTPLTTYRYRVLAKNADGNSLYRTGTFDCNATLSTCYTGAKTADWILMGRPPCWCKSVVPRQCHGDADGRSQGKSNYWVSTWDLEVLVAAWSRPSYKTHPTDPNRITEDQTITTGGGNAIRLVCADFDNTLQGKTSYRVSTWDLAILTAAANWSRVNLPDPNCP